MEKRGKWPKKMKEGEQRLYDCKIDFTNLSGLGWLARATMFS